MIQLRPYQDDYVDQSREAIRQGTRRIILAKPTGSGKTITACRIIQLTVENGRRALFLAPARELVSQCSRKLSEFGLDHGIIMAGRGYRTDLPIQVGCTPTLLSRVLRRKSLKPPPADLVVLDECRLQGNSTRELLALYPRAVLLGLDATPVRSDGRGLGGLCGFQKIIQAVSRSQLIAEGYIVRTRVYGPYRPDMARTREEIAAGVRATGPNGDYTPSFRASRMDKAELVGDIVTQWKRLGQNRPTMLFASNVSHSVHCCAAFNAAGIPAVHMDASTPDEERRRLLGDEYGEGAVARGEVKVLTSYGVLVSGIDLPCVGCIVMARPTKSLPVFYQAVGRGVRPYKGPLYDKDGYCVLLDHAGCWERHGLPDQDVEWPLDTDRKVEDVQEEKKSQKPNLITCPECFAVFEGRPECPECGARMKRQRKPQELKEQKDGMLVEVEQDPVAAAAAGRLKLVRQWQRALAITAARDGTASMALAIFKQATGLLPWAVPGLPHVPAGSDEWRRRVRELFPGYYKGGRP